MGCVGIVGHRYWVFQTCWGYFANLREKLGLTQLFGSHDAVHQAPEM